MKESVSGHKQEVKRSWRKQNTDEGCCCTAVMWHAVIIHSYKLHINPDFLLTFASHNNFFIKKKKVTPYSWQPSRPRRHLQSSSVLNMKQMKNNSWAALCWLRRDFAHFLQQQWNQQFLHMKCLLCPSSIFRWKKSSRWRTSTSNCRPHPSRLDTVAVFSCSSRHSCAAVATKSRRRPQVLILYHTSPCDSLVFTLIIKHALEMRTRSLKPQISGTVTSRWVDGCLYCLVQTNWRWSECWLSAN